MGKNSIPTTILLLAALAFHFVTPTLGRQGSCGCSKHGHEVGISCNCPGCLAERGDLACYCSSESKTRPEETKGVVVSLKPIRCTCGSQDPMANPLNPVPFIPHSGPAGFMMAPADSVEIAEVELSLEEVILPRDRPG